jgi:hypothetical protein
MFFGVIDIQLVVVVELMLIVFVGAGLAVNRKNVSRYAFMALLLLVLRWASVSAAIEFEGNNKHEVSDFLSNIYLRAMLNFIAITVLVVEMARGCIRRWNVRRKREIIRVNQQQQQIENKGYKNDGQPQGA